MQRRLPSLESGHAPIERRRIFLDHFLDQSKITDVDRRENMMASTALEQK